MDLGPHHEIDNSLFRNDKHIYFAKFAIAKNVKNYVSPPGPVRPQQVNGLRELKTIDTARKN